MDVCKAEIEAAKAQLGEYSSRIANDVPANSLLQGGKEGWFKLIGPDASKSQQFMLNKQDGERLPVVKNIEILDKK